MTSAFYDIQHTLNLSAHQRRLLAIGITKLHSTAFVTSKFSVHVKFRCSMVYPHLPPAEYFVGGEELRACNRIVAYVQRNGFGRRNMKSEDEMTRRLAKSIEVMWDSYLCSGKSTELIEARLHAIIVIPGAISGWKNFELWDEESVSEINCLTDGFEVKASEIRDEKSTSEISCLTDGYEFKVPQVWDTDKSSDESSISPSEYSSNTWNYRGRVSYETTPCSERRVEPSTDETPKLRTRLNRKAKFYYPN